MRLAILLTFAFLVSSCSRLGIFISNEAKFKDFESYFPSAGLPLIIDAELINSNHNGKTVTKAFKSFYNVVQHKKWVRTSGYRQCICVAMLCKNDKYSALLFCEDDFYVLGKVSKYFIITYDHLGSQIDTLNFAGNQNKGNHQISIGRFDDQKLITKTILSDENKPSIIYTVNYQLDSTGHFNKLETGTKTSGH